MPSLRHLATSIAGSRRALPTLAAAAFAVALLHERIGLFNGYAEFVLITAGINIILCASLNLVNGYMGEFSVGHAGFMAAGAYVAGLLTVKVLPGSTPAWAFPLVVTFGGAVAAAIGFLLALLSFKTRGDYLAIITLAFLMIMKSALENMPFAGGPHGLSGMGRLTTLPQTAGWTILALWVIRNLVYSKFGRAIVAIREDELAAGAMGVRTREAKILAFVVSSFFGGVGGALFAHQLQFINPATFDIMRSTGILVMVYIGGVGSLTGSVLGAVLVTVLTQLLQPLGTWHAVVMPLTLVFLMLFRPRGLMGLRECAWFLPAREALRREREPHREAPPGCARLQDIRPDVTASAGSPPRQP
ncbi:branched-chain amino acid ABC transporter permease [Opitutaceae bacterium TAV5]|nr:branched-chain amino acid ABC transporter permease [Opitutaceae bacterium TAV5]